MEKMPDEIFMLECYEAAKAPVPLKKYLALKGKYPIYWNDIGEFDPHFKRRNRLVNFIRKIFSRKVKLIDKT